VNRPVLIPEQALTCYPYFGATWPVSLTRYPC